jgi:hypothetical protein
MKKIITIWASILFTTTLFAQSPEKMSYQAVVRDGSNSLVTTSVVGMQISILQGSTSGSTIYVETQTPTSNANGLVSLEIGSGTIVSGTFSTIDWANGPYFIKTETDPNGGTNYTITGTSQLLSVPYALHAKNTDSWKVNNDTTYTFKKVGIGLSSPKAPFHVFGTPNSTLMSLSTNSASQPFTNFSSRSIIYRDTTNSANIRLSYEPPSSSLSVNSQPTILLFSDTSEGPDRHFRIRFNGGNRFTVSGNGTTSINSVLHLTPRNSSPSNPEKGMIYMDNITNKLRVYDGTIWQNCW